MRFPVFPGCKMVLFAALSVCDFLLTWHLLHLENGGVYEGNPIARWWLVHQGWAGLAAFKAVAMLLVLGLAALIYLKRPRTCHALLAFSCLTLLGVVGYSVYLMDVVRRDPYVWDTNEERLQEDQLSLETSIRQGTEYRTILTRSGHDVLEKRCSLEEALDHLANTQKGIDAGWHKLLQLSFPGLQSDRSRLAANLVQHLCATAPNENQARQVVQVMAPEFRRLLGEELPPEVLGSYYRGRNFRVPPGLSAAPRERGRSSGWADQRSQR